MLKSLGPREVTWLIKSLLSKGENMNSVPRARIKSPAKSLDVLITRKKKKIQAWQYMLVITMLARSRLTEARWPAFLADSVDTRPNEI